MNGIIFSPKVYEKLNQIKRRDKGLYLRVRIKLKLFVLDQNHPSLRKHKLSGIMVNSWSISINRSIRMIYQVKGQKYYFIEIGKHEEVYK